MCFKTKYSGYLTEKNTSNWIKSYLEGNSMQQVSMENSNQIF